MQQLQQLQAYHRAFQQALAASAEVQAHPEGTCLGQSPASATTDAQGARGAGAPGVPGVIGRAELESSPDGDSADLPDEGDSVERLRADEVRAFAVAAARRHRGDNRPVSEATTRETQPAWDKVSVAS